jgi:hypothetical protein
VTLHEHGELRGCMGQLDWDRSMWANVMAAGTIVPREDPRFMPVSVSELPAIRLDISVLGPRSNCPVRRTSTCERTGSSSNGRAAVRCCCRRWRRSSAGTRGPPSRRCAARRGCRAMPGGTAARACSPSGPCTNRSPASRADPPAIRTGIVCRSHTIARASLHRLRRRAALGRPAPASRWWIGSGVACRTISA